MAKARVLEHGKRNRSLCKELLNGKVYYDWVITTAFYSAIHLLEHKLLPITIEQTKCDNIAQVRRSLRLKGRHIARERLVEQNTEKAISTRYKWLDDQSRYARYTTYKLSNAEADKAEKYLGVIHDYCTQ